MGWKIWWRWWPIEEERRSWWRKSGLNFSEKKCRWSFFFFVWSCHRKRKECKFLWSCHRIKEERGRDLYNLSIKCCTFCLAEIISMTFSPVKSFEFITWSKISFYLPFPITFGNVHRGAVNLTFLLHIFLKCILFVWIMLRGQHL